MSVNTYLTSLASDLVLSSDEKSSISRSIVTLQSRLQAYFGTAISDHFQFGSSTRGTILPRRADSNSDIDYMVVFNTSTESQKKPQTYLDRLKRFAESKYSTSEIHQSSPTVVLSLNHIRFEIVPAVCSNGYMIPSTASSWVEWMYTDPHGTSQALQDKNQSCGYLVKPLVRLMKYWNASKGHPFPSFSIEQYIVGKSFWMCTALKDYFYALWAGLNCSYDTAEYIKQMVENAKQYVANAKQYEANSLPASAELEIKKIVPEL